jgi:hypothetical protein
MVNHKSIKGEFIMEKEKLLPLSIICLSISLVVSSTIISKGMRESSLRVSNSLTGSITSIVNSVKNNIDNEKKQVNNNTNQTDKDLMTLSEAGNYLGTSANNLYYSIENKSITVPYTKIEGNYMFSKKAIDKWIETQMKQ